MKKLECRVEEIEKETKIIKKEVEGLKEDRADSFAEAVKAVSEIKREVIEVNNRLIEDNKQTKERLFKIEEKSEKQLNRFVENQIIANELLTKLNNNFLIVANQSADTKMNKEALKEAQPILNFGQKVMWLSKWVFAPGFIAGIIFVLFKIRYFIEIFEKIRSL